MLDAFVHIVSNTFELGNQLGLVVNFYI